MREINYTIENTNHKVFIENEIVNLLIRDIINLKSDRKILFIYDENIDKFIVKNYLDELKTTEMLDSAMAKAAKFGVIAPDTANGIIEVL